MCYFFCLCYLESFTKNLHFCFHLSFPSTRKRSTFNIESTYSHTWAHSPLMYMYVPLGGRYQTAARVIRVSSSPFDKLCSYTRIERWLLCSVDLPPMGMRLNNDPCTFVGNHRQLKGLSNILLSIIFVYVHRDSARLPVAALLMFLAQASLTTGTQLPLCGSVCVWWQLV